MATKPYSKGLKLITVNGDEGGWRPLMVRLANGMVDGGGGGGLHRTIPGGLEFALHC